MASVASLAFPPEDAPYTHHSHHHRHKTDRVSEKLLAQVADWLEREKNKKQFRTIRRPSSKRSSPPRETPGPDNAEAVEFARKRAPSLDSQASDVSLDRLQRIIDDSMAAMGLTAVPHYSLKPGRRQSKRSLQLQRTASSDTEWNDGDVVVPSCDAYLDNAKAMSYSGGKAASDQTVPVLNKRGEREKKAWVSFKNEIIRIAHTLRLKGWRRVPLDSGEGISCERLSGALTNAVYVVSPPPDVVAATPEGKKPPAKVLLRVYGPHVEHLIDRENELSVLQRLARKKIGSRLLGTFLNGRFEEFFNATTLTHVTMRDPDTSRQIAKRMRELHDGVELLEVEKDEGPGVWCHWDKWLETVEKTITFLDRQILEDRPGPIRGPADAWRTRGLICGVEWHRFRAAVEAYRRFLNETYGSPQAVRERLVFAHNDVSDNPPPPASHPVLFTDSETLSPPKKKQTQYGNILRVLPDDKKSPLLQPANKHKQLVVIDFEYAAANVRGLEFANHFTEWMYNYHDPAAPWACNTAWYPSLEEQRCFVRAYIDHRPQYATPGASTPNLPSLGPPAIQSTASLSSMADFMLDARMPPGGSPWTEIDRAAEEAAEARVSELLEETRLWRIANSAQWIVWGIVQAKVPGLDLSAPVAPASASGTGVVEGTAAGVHANGDNMAEEDEGVADAEADGFDYLRFAQDRAMLFWGDCVRLGIVKAEELPDEVRARIKIVKG